MKWNLKIMMLILGSGLFAEVRDIKISSWLHVRKFLLLVHGWGSWVIVVCSLFLVWHILGFRTSSVLFCLGFICCFLLDEIIQQILQLLGFRVECHFSTKKWSSVLNQDGWCLIGAITIQDHHPRSPPKSVEFQSLSKSVPSPFIDRDHGERTKGAQNFLQVKEMRQAHFAQGIQWAAIHMVFIEHHYSYFFVFFLRFPGNSVQSW
jgi:hypothetical protein